MAEEQGQLDDLELVVSKQMTFLALQILHQAMNFFRRK